MMRHIFYNLNLGFDSKRTTIIS